jgi:hypothetical protein
MDFIHTLHLNLMANAILGLAKLQKVVVADFRTRQTQSMVVKEGRINLCYLIDLAAE